MQIVGDNFELETGVLLIVPCAVRLADGIWIDVSCNSTDWRFPS